MNRKMLLAVIAAGVMMLAGVGEEADGTEAAAFVCRVKPDVLLLSHPSPDFCLIQRYNCQDAGKMIKCR